MVQKERLLQLGAWTNMLLRLCHIFSLRVSRYGELNKRAMALLTREHLDNEIIFRFESSTLFHPVIHIGNFCGLRGHDSLQMTSEVPSDIKFEFSGLNNLHSTASLPSDCCFALNTDGRKKAKYHDHCTRFRSTRGQWPYRLASNYANENPLW